MKIIHKDKWGFWPLQWYTFIVENDEQGLMEISVKKDIWLRFGVGDYYDAHYHQFYKYDQPI